MSERAVRDMHFSSWLPFSLYLLCCETCFAQDLYLVFPSRIITPDLVGAYTGRLEEIVSAAAIQPVVSTALNRVAFWEVQALLRKIQEIGQLPFVSISAPNGSLSERA